MCVWGGHLINMKDKRDHIYCTAVDTDILLQTEVEICDSFYNLNVSNVYCRGIGCSINTHWHVEKYDRDPCKNLH